VLEGFSAGVPVVAVASGGIAEAVRDNITGFLTSAPTAEALAARLRKVMQGPPRELVRVGKNARREWERYWNVDRWRREVIAAIRATAMGRDAARPAALAASGAASGDHRSASA
jgi:glycosyltransferase involved in cell wall biosynthesis